MKVVLLIAAWVISALAYNKKASSRDCGTVLSSVRMEVSPTLLHLICSNNNHTTLVVDCGSNIWYEKLTGFCNSFDLNIGQVLMNQPLLSSTITLQLVKSGQILDAARVAILTSEHLLHYRISVWGNRNTRFVLAIEKGCTPSQHNGMSGTLQRDEQSSVGKSSRHLPLLHVNSELPLSDKGRDASLSQNDPSYVTGSGVPEYLRPNKLANVEYNNYALLKLQQLLPGSREASRFGNKPTQIEIYRSKVSKPEPGVDVDHLQQYDEDYSEDDFMTTTPESSELAKLRWMEEKRILFEQRMKFLRNFYPESEDTADNESPSVDDPEENIDTGTVNLKETVNKLSTRIDYYKDVNEPSSSADSGRHAGDSQHSRYTETPSGVYDHQQIRRSERLQLSRKDSHNEEYKKLEYRQLSHSDASLDRNNDGTSWFIQTLHPSVKSVFSNTLSTTQPQEALFKKTHKSFTSAEISSNELGVTNTTHVNNSSLQTVNKSITGDKFQSVFREPLHNNGISTNTIAKLLETHKGTVQSFQSSTTSINVIDKIFTTKFSGSNSYSQGTTETTPSDIFSQNATNSHHLHNVDKDGIDISTPTTSIDNLIPALSIAVGRVLHNVTSKLQNELQHNLRSPSDVAITEDSVRDTTAVPNVRLSTSTQAQMEGRTFLSSSVSDKLNNHVQPGSTNMVKENNALFTSPLMNSLYSSTEKLEKVKYSISSMYAISTIPAKIHSSALDGQNDPSPVTLPTSQSFPHSVPLEMKTSSRGPSVQYNLPYFDDETASPATTEEQPIPAGKHVIAETVTNAVTRVSQLKGNNTDIQQTVKAKAVQIKDTIQSFLVFSNDTTQVSATSGHNTTKVPSEVLKRENRGSPIVLENRSTEAIVQLDITVTEHTVTTISAGQGTTSTLQTSTGTPQDGENEPQEMGDDSFWPVVAALVIGIPVIVVLVIAITVIHKKRRLDPGNLFHRAALKISRNSSVVTLRRKPMGARRQDNVINLRLDTVSTFSQDTSHPPSIDV